MPRAFEPRRPGNLDAREAPAARLVLVIALASSLFSGCTRESTPNHYESLNGRVVERQTQTGEMTVQIETPAPRPGEKTGPEKDAGERRTLEKSGEDNSELRCVVTKDSEIWLNDRLSSIEAVEPGDLIRILGYRDKGPGLERFVISYGRVQRPEPPANVPDFMRAALDAAREKK